MKTKRLFLKLVLAVCFLMAVPPREAEAATEIDLSSITGPITITSDRGIIDKDNNQWALDASGYLLKNTPSGEATININASGKLKIAFQDVGASKAVNLNIMNGEITIEINGENNILRAKDGNPAVKITGGSLHFAEGTPDNLMNIKGATGVNAVEGGAFHIDSGNVMVEVGSSANAFGAGSDINVKGGTLSCYDETNTGMLTALGKDVIFFQTGGYVSASDVARISFKEEKIYIADPTKYNFYKNNAPIGADWTSGGVTIMEDWLPSTIKAQPKEADKGYNQTFTIPARPAAPVKNNLKVTNETTSGKYDGKINNVTKDMDIFQGNDAPATTSSSWIKVEEYPAKLTEGNVLEGLKPGTYWLRYQSTSTSFASEPVSVTINRGGTLDAELKHVFESKDFGYDNFPAAIGVKITNLDTKANVIIDSVTLNNIRANGEATTLNPFRIIDDDANKVISASGSPDTSWKIQPVLGLPAGEYTADVKIEYQNGYKEKQEPITLSDAVQFTVNKQKYPGDAAPPAPDATKVKKITFESVELEPIPDDEKTGAKVQYGVYDADPTKIKWQDSPVITGLDSEKEYQFVARYKESDNYQESKRSDLSEKVKTEKKASIIYSSKELSLIPGREYLISVSGSGDSDKCKSDKANGNIDIKDKWFGKTIILSDELKGTTQELSIPDIGKAPTSPKGQAESFSSAGDGKILGVTTSMEYKLKGSDEDWITCPAKTIENLAAGTYLVRTKAVDEGTGENKKYTFASQAKEVVVARGNALSITPETFDLGKSPYKVLPTAKAIAFRNHDKTEDITIKSIALSDDSPFAILHKETDSAIVPAGKNNETFKIQPKPDLNVGTYTDEFVVTFEVGYNPDADTSTGDGQIQAQSEGFNTDSPDTSGEKSAAIPITFTVEKGTQEAPPVPAEKSVKSTSITLETIPNSTVSGAKAQYSKDSGKTWQDSPTFNKLKADTEYYFVSRYAATDNYNESDISAGENAITTAEKDDDDDTDNSNKNVSSNANGSNGTNGTSGTNGTNGTNGTTGTNTTGTNGTNGTNNTNGTTSRGVSAARTGDLNNIQLWVTLMIGSYLSCYLIIRDRIKKARIK